MRGRTTVHADTKGDAMNTRIWVSIGVPMMVLMVWLFAPHRPVKVAPLVATPASNVAKNGRYLTILGNCQSCHTARGGIPFAGGRAIDTPFGTVYSSNLTPSPAGLGLWSADDFWRALHHGQSRDGRWLNPAFPYTNTTLIHRADSDAMYAYLRELPAIDQEPPAHRLQWPLGTQPALKLWRFLYFDEGPALPPAPASVGWTPPTPLERGAYLVNGPGHCSACHMTRNALGGNSNMFDLSGGLMAVHNWVAPSLLDPAQAGVQDWSLEDTVAFFRTGRNGFASAHGPMAEVVQHSTQHWSANDLLAMATYLQQLPRVTASSALKPTAPDTRGMATGGKLYDQHCAQCHGALGQGIRLSDHTYAYPALAENRAVTLNSPANLVQTVLNGGFGVSTESHPRPFGMPPFALDLSDADLADLLTFVRNQWGNHAPPVSALDIKQLRGPVGQ